MHPAEKYIKDVVDGKAIVGEYVRLAVERHINDLDKGKNFDYYFDPAAGDLAISMAQVMRHWKGQKAGERIILEDHQQFYFWSLYGWKRRDDHTRRFRTSFKSVARKNAKTTESALKAIIHFLLDGEAGQQVYAAATKEDQARIVVNDTGQIIKITPELRNRFTLFKSRDKISRVVKKDLSGFMTAIGSDSDTQDGFDPTMGIIDEYHAHPNDKMINVIESGVGARLQWLIDIITTAGFNKDGPCYSNLRKSCIDILKGDAVDDSTLALIYEIDEDDDWENPELWVKPNPNLGVSVGLDFLKTRYIKAKNEGASKEVDFKTKNLNMWTDSAVTWIPDDVWAKCSGVFNPSELSKCYCGLDLAISGDTNSFIALWPIDDNRVGVKLEVFIPEDTLAERMRGENVRYMDWVRDGLIHVTPGNVSDYGYIENKILEYAEKYGIEKLAYDRYNATALISSLYDKGINVESYIQGPITMNTPIRELERLIRMGGVMHGGNPVLRWMARNVLLRMDSGGNVKFDKEKSTGRIDGIVAMAMAYGIFSTSEPEFRSKYEDNPELDTIEL